MDSTQHYDAAEKLLEEAESNREPDTRAEWCLELAKMHLALSRAAAAELRGSLDERKREAERRKRAQAMRVLISQKQEDNSWQPKIFANPNPVPALEVTVTVENSSDQPIYDAELRWHCGSASYGDPNPEPLGTIMPTVVQRTRKFPLGTDMAVSGATLRFRDAAGITWIRRPDGCLTEQQ